MRIQETKKSYTALVLGVLLGLSLLAITFVAYDIYSKHIDLHSDTVKYLQIMDTRDTGCVTIKSTVNGVTIVETKDGTRLSVASHFIMPYELCGITDEQSEN